MLAGRLVVPPEYVPQLSVCGPIVQEVLQGLKPVAASDVFAKHAWHYRFSVGPEKRSDDTVVGA
jgi:hypothetical protein